MEKIIDNAISFAQDFFTSSHDAAHDWYHTDRVLQMARRIASTESDADTLVVQLAAILHDVADDKLHGGDETKGLAHVRSWLDQQELNSKVVDHVMAIIDNMSFRKQKFGQVKFESPELYIVRDADRLDAIGALGIARTFAYGGGKGRPFYDPKADTRSYDDIADYRSGSGSSYNHFHEKILLLKDMLHTDEAKRIGEDRHQFVVDFLSQFIAEWNGEK